MKIESIFLDDYYDENQSSSNNVKQVGSIANRKTSKRDNPNEYRVYLAGGGVTCSEYSTRRWAHTIHNNLKNVEYYCCASRGRDPDNPNDRSANNPNYTQRLEVNMGGVSNTLTMVAKDNYILEIWETEHLCK